MLGRALQRAAADELTDVFLGAMLGDGRRPDISAPRFAALADGPSAPSPPPPPSPVLSGHAASLTPY